MVTYIYCLVDPRTELSFYVGKSNDPSNRYKNTSHNLAVRERFATLRSLGLTYSILVLEEASITSWHEREVFWINKLRKDGHPLLNLSKGGHGGCAHTLEARIRISNSLKGRQFTDDWRARISQNRSGISPSSETRQKLREAARKQTKHRVGPHSEETKRKISESRKGKGTGPRDPEVGRRISEAKRGKPGGMLGKKHTEDTKRKIGESNRKFWHND